MFGLFDSDPVEIARKYFPGLQQAQKEEIVKALLAQPGIAALLEKHGYVRKDRVQTMKPRL